MISTKSTFSRKVRRNFDFGTVFASQTDEKSKKNSIEKHVFFRLRFFGVFLAIFSDFGSILGGHGTTANWEKIEKIVFGTLWERVWDF